MQAPSRTHARVVSWLHALRATSPEPIVNLARGFRVPTDVSTSDREPRPARTVGWREEPEARPGCKVALALGFAGFLAFATLFVFNYALGKGSPRGSHVKAEADMHAFADAITLYRRDTHRLPESWEDLVRPHDVPGWNGPYLKASIPELFLDPWRRPYGYAVVSQDPPLVRFTSLGADGAPGGAGRLSDVVREVRIGR